MGYENFMEAGARVQTQRKEKKEGESINELIFNNPKSAYIAGAIFERNQPQGIEIAEKIIQGIPLDDAENEELRKIRDEIVRIKRDVEGVYEMMKQGRMLDELVSVDWYFSEIRKSVGLNNMSSVIKFEDLVQMRLSDEAGFGQLMINCQSYKDSFENFAKTGQDRLKQYVKRFGISQYKIEELLDIPLAEEARLREKIREIIKSKLHLLSIKKLYQPENELVEILKEEKRARTKLNVERHDIATSLKDILVNNADIETRIEENIAKARGGGSENSKQVLTYQETRDLYGRTAPLVDKEFDGDEAEDLIAEYWGNEYRIQKAMEVMGKRYLEPQEVNNFWANVSDAGLKNYQNHCFETYKKRFKERNLQPKKNGGSWFGKLVKIIDSILNTKNLDAVTPNSNCRERMRRNL